MSLSGEMAELKTIMNEIREKCREKCLIAGAPEALESELMRTIDRMEEKLWKLVDRVPDDKSGEFQGKVEAFAQKMLEFTDFVIRAVEKGKLH